MSNAVELFGGAKAASAFAALGAPESLAEGIGASYGRIGYKGKNLVLHYKGETHPFLRPDDGTPANYLDVIILRQAKVKSKSFYEKFDPNGSSEGKRPICASTNGIVPDADVTQKQAEACAICPRNVLQTNAEGRRHRDCTDYKRLAVLLLPVDSARLLGTQLLEPVFLRIPPASLEPLSKFGDLMAGRGYHFASFVTRITFNPDKAHPEFVFKAIGLLGDAEASVVIPMITDSTTSRIVGETETTNAPRLAAPTIAPVAMQIAAPVAQAVAPAPPPAQVLQQVIPPTPKAPPPPPATGGFGFNLKDVTPPPAQPAPAQAPMAPVAAATATVSDTGAPQMADADLDARIAALMP